MKTFEGEPIDIELPSSVSGQHLVNFNLRVQATKRDRDEREGKPAIRAEMTLPVHLRYPAPGCERRGEDCDEYAWVQVSEQAPQRHACSPQYLACTASSTRTRFMVVPNCVPVVVAIRPW